jgi:hypothetical protein
LRVKKFKSTKIRGAWRQRQGQLSCKEKDQRWQGQRQWSGGQAVGVERQGKENSKRVHSRRGCRRLRW